MAKRWTAAWLVAASMIVLVEFHRVARATDMCGDLNEPCCSGFCMAPMLGTCNAGLVCGPGPTCVPCGGAAQPCCLNMPDDHSTGPAANDGVVEAPCSAGLVCRGESVTQNGVCFSLSAAPALSHGVLAVAGILLLGGGVWLTRRRRIKR